jgi:hypothetical protein
VFTGEDEEDEERKLPIHIRTCKAITEVTVNFIRTSYQNL